MIKSLKDTITLNNGVKMPGFGLGVYKVEEDIAVDAVRTALKNGYRSIDTASFYQNEKGVGKGLRESGVSRDEIFVTSKVWNDEQGYDRTLEAYERSLNQLGLDYLDLYLIHWPVKDKYKETWRAMERLYEEGSVRAIGVSNFHVHQLKDLMKDSNVKPAVDQIELHPHLTQEDLRAFCEGENIRIEAWSPLKKGRIFEEPGLKEIAQKYEKTPAQVILRWNIQHEIITIPKSTNEKRIIENANIFDFSLTEQEMASIDQLNKGERTGTNPDSFDE